MKQKLINNRKAAFQIALTLSIFLAILQPAKAQNPIAVIDSQLRALFSPLWHPSPGPNYLLEMASHQLDSIYFTDNNPDTLDRDKWHELYREMRAAAYDTNIITPLPHDTVFYHGLAWKKDTIVMDILALNYLTFNDSALSTDFYYDFDTVNNVITDKHPGEQNPFLTERVFASCPVKYQLPYQNVVYRVDPDFIFYDSPNNIDSMGWVLEIDFGDGAGWQMFNTTTVQHYSATYPSAGAKYIRTRVSDPSMGMAIIMSSIAKVIVPNKIKPPTPANKISLPGLTAGVYDPCSESGEPLKKTVIVLEGYDPGDCIPGLGTTVEDIYGDLVQGTDLEDLRNLGYTFVVVNFAQTGLDIRVNAGHLMELINHLKCEHLTPADTYSHEQFVIVAQSMGGLVARYAMCFMEQYPHYNPSWCAQDKMHNTRLLITFDSPHEGVNIPLAYQWTYRAAGNLLLGANNMTQALTGGMSNLLLDATSVKQMLLYHVNSANTITGTNGPDIAKGIFDTDLATLGTNPQYAKVLAMANGSIKGRGQTRYYDGTDRVPNDYLIDYAQTQTLRLFGQDFILMKRNWEARTTPNGSGTLHSNNIDIYRPKIKLIVKITFPCLFCVKIFTKIEVSSVYWYSIGRTINAVNMEPYDVIPGSVDDETDFLVSEGGDEMRGLFKFLFFGFDNPDYNGSGSWSLNKFIGGGKFGAGATATFHTDGMNTCFVPTFSAMSYNLGSNGYWHDIEGENISTKTSATAFDVITGITENYREGRSLSIGTTPGDTMRFNIYRYNRLHTFTRNDVLGSYNNLTFDNVTNHWFRYDSCSEVAGGFKHFLNREIGDDSIVIDNRTSHWSCLYDAEKHIEVIGSSPSGGRNIYYEYPCCSTSLRMPGVYSKQNPYTIGSGTSYFLAINADVNINTSLSGSYIIDSVHWVRCCGTGFKQGNNPENSIVNNPIKRVNTPGSDDFLVYPNPVTDNQLIITFPALRDEHTKVTVFDAQGRKVIERDFVISQSKGKYQYKLNFDQPLASGTYYLVLKNKSAEYKKALIVSTR